MNNIYFIGMPGSGKSAFGWAYAKRMKRPYIDTDAEIEKCEGSISEIFENKGEAYFREVESRILKEVSAGEDTIVSTGGGIILDPKNIETMKNTGVICFIDRPLDKIKQNIEPESRPLIADDLDNLDRLYEQREGIYRGCADVIILNKGSMLAVLYKISRALKRVL